MQHEVGRYKGQWNIKKPQVGKYDVASQWEMEASRTTFSLDTQLFENQHENGSGKTRGQWISGPQVSALQ